MLTGRRGSGQRVGGPKCFAFSMAVFICASPAQSNFETWEKWPGLPQHGGENVWLCPDPRRGAEGQPCGHVGAMRSVDSVLKAVGSYGRLKRESDKSELIIRKPSIQQALALCGHGRASSLQGLN